MSAESEKVILDFFRFFSARDLDAVMGLWGDDAVYHNIPVAPIRGRDGIRAIFSASPAFSNRSPSVTRSV